jgi:hypothetical protein
MDRDRLNNRSCINPDMTILDIISSYRRTESIFKQYDEKAGVCLCCLNLFDSLKDVAGKYCLDLEEMMAELRAVIEDSKY